MTQGIVYIRPLHKKIFFNFQKCRAVLCDISIDKQLSEKAFCSNIAILQCRIHGVPGGDSDQQQGG